MILARSRHRGRPRQPVHERRGSAFLSGSWLLASTSLAPRTVRRARSASTILRAFATSPVSGSSHFRLSPGRAVIVCWMRRSSRPPLPRWMPIPSTGERTARPAEFIPTWKRAPRRSAPPFAARLSPVARTRSRAESNPAELLAGAGRKGRHGRDIGALARVGQRPGRAGPYVNPESFSE